MQGQRIGYIRVSSFDQNPDRQLEQIEVGKVFTDKASGKDTQRPELERLLAFVREGDTVVVIEAMKREQPLKAHKAGTVTGLTAEVGATVTNGQVICELKD